MNIATHTLHVSFSPLFPPSTFPIKLKIHDGSKVRDISVILLIISEYFAYICKTLIPGIWSFRGHLGLRYITKMRVIRTWDWGSDSEEKTVGQYHISSQGVQELIVQGTSPSA